MSGCHGWMDGWIKVEEPEVVAVTVRARSASLGELVTYSCLVFRATAKASVIRPLIINDQHNNQIITEFAVLRMFFEHT